MARDRRDAMTMDLFAGSGAVARAAAAGIDGLVSALDRLAAIVGALPARALPRFTDFPVTRTGPLADAEKDEIEELAEMGIKPWSIARRLQRHPSTVTWFMSTIGLKRLGEARKSPFTRGGKQVRPFTEEEDEFAVACSCDGDPPAAIARKMAARFGYDRSRDTVACRLMMLASDEAAREAA